MTAAVVTGVSRRNSIGFAVARRLLEGRYPDYRKVLPQKQPIKIPLQVGPFLSAVRQAAIVRTASWRFCVA